MVSLGNDRGTRSLRIQSSKSLWGNSVDYSSSPRSDSDWLRHFGSGRVGGRSFTFRLAHASFMTRFDNSIGGLCPLLPSFRFRFRSEGSGNLISRSWCFGFGFGFRLCFGRSAFHG
jgi:hypothetical protein